MPADDVVYAGSLDYGLYTLDAATREFLWVYETEFRVIHQPIIVDDLIIVGDLGGSVYALREPSSP